jgi:hypothetical protein
MHSLPIGITDDPFNNIGNIYTIPVDAPQAHQRIAVLGKSTLR